MKTNFENEKNAQRFTGFADTYDKARPRVPYYPVKVIAEYLGKNAQTVVDLGSGTGLSTLVWQGNCDRVIGIEPSADMLKIAKEKENEFVSFKQGLGSSTGLESSIADVVICSQSFHWMNPNETLEEVNRILKHGGVFATVDCDWPPVMQWRVEREYMRLYKKVKKLELELDDVKNSFSRYSKDKHLENIKNSGYFRYCREIVFSNTEKCNASRLLNLVLSQGSLQTVYKLHNALIKEDIERFDQFLKDTLAENEFEIDFSYRMRIAVK